MRAMYYETVRRLQRSAYDIQLYHFKALHGHGYCHIIKLMKMPLLRRA